MVFTRCMADALGVLQMLFPRRVCIRVGACSQHVPDSGTTILEIKLRRTMVRVTGKIGAVMGKLSPALP